LKLSTLFCLILISTNAFGNNFYLGKESTSWGVQVSSMENSKFSLKLGTRLQTITNFSSQQDNLSDSKKKYFDSSIRRSRLQVEAKYKEGIKLYMDIRNDNINEDDRGEGDFNLGDGYIEVKNIFSIDGLNFRAFRAKVHVSRSETVSSSKILIPNRAYIADEAAQFISHNRRASNIQLLGNHDKLSYQVVLGDGIHKSKFYDSIGSSLSSGSIDRQSLMYGGKIRINPFSNWINTKKVETYFGEGKHFSLGAGFFSIPKIEYQNSSGSQVDDLSRSLLNLDVTFHYKNLSIQSEFFKFDGVVKDFNANQKTVGKSDGFYLHGEYVLDNFYYISPFFRIESWDKFKDEDNYDLNSQILGVNWYLKGNQIRVGLMYQRDSFESEVYESNGRGEVFDKVEHLKLYSMWHY